MALGGAVFGLVVQVVQVKQLLPGLSLTTLPMTGLSQSLTVPMVYPYRPLIKSSAICTILQPERVAGPTLSMKHMDCVKPL